MDVDVFVVGGGPSGATAAWDLARAGRSVAMLDRAGRIKPCGGAIPPRAISDFDIPDHLLVAKVETARMISPTGRKVDIHIENGFVGMVDREDFDEFLRKRAVDEGAVRLTGTYLRIERERGARYVVWRDKATGEERRTKTRMVIGADGARSVVARDHVPGGDKIPYVIAYHEIVRAPAANATYDPKRCDVVYDGRISGDFYGWVFPHGDTASIGMGSGLEGADLKQATADLRAASGLSDCETIRKEGAPIPLHPLDRWDNGRDVILAGDAAGVVAPSSGEGIYYAMFGGRVAAKAAREFLNSGLIRDLGLARKLFMKEHKTVFKVLRSMQDAYYKSDERRERFVSLCHDEDVQKLTFEAYMNKKLVSARPLAHIKIGLKNVAHLLRLVSPVYTGVTGLYMSDFIPAWVGTTLTPVEKLEVHQLGLRHVAVSVFVMAGDAVLIQKRAAGKYHTPGLWANTCCTHPEWGEDPRDCAVRRLDEELGIKGVDPVWRDQVEYRADVGGGLTEHEVVEIFVADADKGLKLRLNPAEVSDTRWISLADLTDDTRKRPDRYTPWLRIYLDQHMDRIFGMSRAS